MPDGVSCRSGESAVRRRAGALRGVQHRLHRDRGRCHAGARAAAVAGGSSRDSGVREPPPGSASRASRATGVHAGSRSSGFGATSGSGAAVDTSTGTDATGAAACSGPADGGTAAGAGGNSARCGSAHRSPANTRAVCGAASPRDTGTARRPAVPAGAAHRAGARAAPCATLGADAARDACRADDSGAGTAAASVGSTGHATDRAAPDFDPGRSHTACESAPGARAVSIGFPG